MKKLRREVYYEIPENELGILKAMLADEDFDFPDIQIDLTDALTDTEDEMRVGDGYMATDRRKFWRKTAKKYISQLNQAEGLLYQLRGYDEPEFNVLGLAYSIMHDYLQTLFSDQKRNLLHIRKYCDGDLVTRLEKEITDSKRELEIFYELPNDSNLN